MKEELIEKVESLLLDAGFEVSDCSAVRSCFDVLARRENNLLLIKVFQNIEGMTYHTAVELKQVAAAMSASCMVIGDHMKNASLDPDVIYTRYGINVVNLQAFSEVLKQKSPLVYSIRGSYCVRINPQTLSEIRKKADLTQDQLAASLGVSKQSVHRYESTGRISLDVAEKLIDFLKEDIRAPKEVFVSEIKNIEESLNGAATELKTQVFNEFISMGFDASLTNAPFDLLATDLKQNQRILTVVSNDRKGLKRKVEILTRISAITGCRKLCISNRGADLDIVVIKPEDLLEIKKAKELLDLLDDEDQ
jgi:putative transcriptional regulator